MDGQAKSISLWASLPQTQEKAKARGTRTGRAWDSQPLPLPAFLPRQLLPLTNRQSNSEEPWPTADHPRPRVYRGLAGLGFKRGTGVWKLRSLYTLAGGCSIQKCVCGFEGTYPMDLWCGKEHIIMATRIPAPQSVTGYQEASLGSKAFQAVAKSNCLVENPFAPCHLAVCISFSQGWPLCYTHAFTSLVDISVTIILYIYVTIQE